MKKKGVPEADELPAKIVLVILILVIVIGVFSIALTLTSPSLKQPPPQLISGGEVSIQLIPPPGAEEANEAAS
ncbi:hypothetical protein HYS49_02230 [Candidatus Woesearchaeota archaeon]|nr:hypothetical protein [Candidatus Woesearchaeota archaeon]